MLKETIPTATELHTSGPPESPCKNMWRYGLIVEQWNGKKKKNVYIKLGLVVTLICISYCLKTLEAVTTCPSLSFRFITEHTPPFCLYPPAQMMFGGSCVMFSLYFFHASLQSRMSTVDTFKAKRSLTTSRCLVEPHPATKHWVLFLML